MKHNYTKFITRFERALVGVGLFMSLVALPVFVGSHALAGTIPVGGGGSGGTDATYSVCQPSTFFGLIPWYNYIGDELYPATKSSTNTDPCGVKCFNVLNISPPNQCGRKESDIPPVLLAVVDDLLRIAGIVAVGYVIYGGARYTASQGNAEQTAQARGTIINALVGLGIALVAIVFVSFVASSLGG